MPLKLNILLYVNYKQHHHNMVSLIMGSVSMYQKDSIIMRLACNADICKRFGVHV